MNIQTEFNLAGKPDVHSKLIVHDRCIYQVPGYLVRQLGTWYLVQPTSFTDEGVFSIGIWYLVPTYALSKRGDFILTKYSHPRMSGKHGLY